MSSEESKENEDNPNLCKVVCPYDRPFEIAETQMCVSECTIIERRDKLCLTNYENNRTVLQLQNLVQSNIENDLTKTFNISLITDDETIIIEEKNTIYEIISSKNKKKNSKTSSIDLGECENTLKAYYNIKEDESLIIYKIDATIEGKTGPSIIYEVFYPLKEPDKLEPLDLTICEGDEINVVYPIELENPESYNKESPYYKDICYNYNTNSKVDLILKDGQKEYSDNNKSLCEEDCIYVGYDPIDKQVECS